MSDESNEKKASKANEGKFWTTLPGILTGVAGTITAIGALIVAISQSGLVPTAANSNTDQENSSSVISSRFDDERKDSEISTLLPEELHQVASSEWNIVANDDFSRNVSNWAERDEFITSDGDKIDIKINGKYYFDTTTTDGFISSIEESNIEVPQSPFYIKADMKRASQADGCFYALTWGTVSDGRYSYRVNDAKREYRLKHYYDYSGERSSKDVIAPRGTNLIKSGELNRLSIIVYNDIVYLFINEQFVEQVFQEYSGRGKIGLQFSVCNDNSQVSFEVDNLEVRVPN